MKRLLIWCLLLPGLHAAAQQVLTVEQAIDLALKNNFDVRLAKNDAAIAANDYAYANWAFAPTLNATATRLWNTTRTKQEFANGSKRDTSGIHSRNLQANVTLSWTLFDGLRMFATRDKLEALRNLGDAAVKEQLIVTVANVIASYYNVVQAKQQQHNFMEQLSIADERTILADGKFQTGLGPKTDWLQSKVDYNAIKASYLRQQTVIDQNKTILNQLMAVEVGNINYDVQDSIPLSTDLVFTKLRDEMMQRNTSLLVAKQNVTVSELQLKESKADYYPTISFNSAYNFNKNNSNAATNSFSPVFNQNGVVNFGFTAAIPIFNGLNVHRQVKNAQLNVSSQRLSYENIRTQVDLSLANAFKDYEYYRMAVELEEESVDLARENAMVALERFKQGVSTVIEVREAQQSLEDANFRLISARYNIKLAETQLLRLNGDLIK
jgi:outer membrane protein TolC